MRDIRSVRGLTDASYSKVSAGNSPLHILAQVLLLNISLVLSSGANRAAPLLQFGVQRPACPLLR